MNELNLNYSIEQLTNQYTPKTRSGEQIIGEQTSSAQRPKLESFTLHPLEIITLRMLIYFKEQSILNGLNDQDISNLKLLFELIIRYGSNIWSDKHEFERDLSALATQNERLLNNRREFKAKLDWQRQCCRILINIVFQMSQVSIFSWQSRRQLESDLARITSEIGPTHIRQRLREVTNPGYQL